MKNVSKMILRLLIVIILFFIINSSAYCQIVDLTSPDFIDVPAICTTNPSHVDCIITLPAYEYGKPYSFTIPIISVLDRPQTIFTKSTEDFQCDLARDYSTLTLSANGIVSLDMDSLCSLKFYNPLEVTFTFNVNYPEMDPETYKVRIPIGRMPVKVALVLDISGSMNLTTSEGPKRWDVLRKCVYLFSRELENFRIDGDSISISYFTNTILHPNLPLKPNFNLITATSEPTRVSSLIDTDMAGRSPLYTTAMGQGLLNGKSKILLNQYPNYNEVVLLFTDGLQNIHPFVLLDGISLDNGIDSLNFKNESIKYYTIATWGAGIIPEVLDSISKNNNGIALQSSNTSNFELSDFFNNQLQYMFYQGSPQIIESTIGKLNNNDIIHTFPINKNITKASIIIALNNNDSIEVKKIEFEGVNIPLESLVEKTPEFIFININFPLISVPTAPSYGDLKITLGGLTETEYQITAIVDDHYLDYTCSTNKSQYTVGDSIFLSAKLKYADKPLNDNNNVVAYILKPGDDIGNLLATLTPSDTLSYEDVNSEVDQKYLNLLNSDTAFYNALLPIEQKVILQNKGNGIYSGYFKETELTGNYKIIFISDGTINELSHFKRTKILTTIFRFGQIEEEAPEVVTDAPAPSTGNQKDYTVLRIRPKNKFGNYMGPGFQTKIKVNFTKMHVRTNNSSKLANDEKTSEPYLYEIKDNLDGSYLLYIANVQPRTNPFLQIQVRDEILYEGKMCPVPVWVYILLIILLILLILLKYYKTTNMRIYKLILWIITILVLLLVLMQYYGILKIFC